MHSFCCWSLTLHGAGRKDACHSCWCLPTKHASGIAPQSCPEEALSSLQPGLHLILQVDKVNALEPRMQSLSDQQLAAKTAELKERAQGKGESLDSLLPEAFAVSARPRLLYIEQGAALVQQHSTVHLYLPAPPWPHSILKRRKCLVAEAWSPTAMHVLTSGPCRPGPTAQTLPSSGPGPTVQTLPSSGRRVCPQLLMPQKGHSTGRLLVVRRAGHVACRQ